MRLYPNRARDAMAKVREPLRLGLQETALGVLEVANSNMLPGFAAGIDGSRL